ncbi:unnamed protein product [Ilex paraguariensis]|uniref:At1g61320/AtMIF1 LRR domain-containing protein n=1 Tax=Ilex paraguariensis TaxID=185542 RepID=A0ABC8U938_9AQUA
MCTKLQKKKKNHQFQRHDLSHDRRRDSCNYEILSSLSLPDEILLRFISLNALQTIALSTRWRGFWNRVALLRHGTIEDIDCAAKKLHLDFSKGEPEIPKQFFWNLVLNSVDPTYQPPSYANFVRSLNLTSVSYLTKEIVSSLVSNFQSLESLTIARCEGLLSLRVDVLSKLLNLTILDCPQLICLYIESYELQSLRYRGPLCCFLLRGVVDLADAMLDFRSGPGYDHYKYKHFDPLVEAAGDVETLTLCGWIFRAVILPPPSIEFSELKDLWRIDNSMEEHNIEALFTFLTACPSLKRLFITIDPTSYPPPSSLSKCYNKLGKQAKLRHLKVVKLEGFTEDENVILLKELLLEVFNVEPRIIVATNGSYPRTIIKIPKHQRKNN